MQHAGRVRSCHEKLDTKGVSGTATYSPSRIFKEQIQGLELTVQERAIKASHHLARWIESMREYGCNVKVMNIQVTIKAQDAAGVQVHKQQRQACGKEGPVPLGGYGDYIPERTGAPTPLCRNIRHETVREHQRLSPLHDTRARMQAEDRKGLHGGGDGLERRKMGWIREPPMMARVSPNAIPWCENQAQNRPRTSGRACVFRYMIPEWPCVSFIYSVGIFGVWG